MVWKSLIITNFSFVLSFILSSSSCILFTIHVHTRMYAEIRMYKHKCTFLFPHHRLTWLLCLFNNQVPMKGIRLRRGTVFWFRCSLQLFSWMSLPITECCPKHNTSPADQFLYFFSTSTFTGTAWDINKYRYCPNIFRII